MLTQNNKSQLNFIIKAMLNYSSANRLHSSYFYRRPIAEQIIEIAIVATINITGDTCFFFKK